MPLKRKRSFNKKNRSNKYNKKNKRKKSKKKSKRLRRKSICNRSRKVYRKRKKSKRGYRRVQMGCAKRQGAKRQGSRQRGARQRGAKRQGARQRGARQRGARQRGGAANYNCEYPNNMGEIITGTKNNLQWSDLTPQTTQNRLPSLALEQKGGGLIGFGGLGTGKLINLGLSHPLTTVRNSMNYLSDIKNTWDADRQLASADPVIAHKMDNS